MCKMMPLEETANQSELTDFQAAGNMKAALHGTETLNAFWVACPEACDTMKTLAIYVLTMFAFSKTTLFKKRMTSLKNNHQTVFAHKPDSCQAQC